MVGGMALGGLPAAGFELPVPSATLVAPGNGQVLPPLVSGNTMTIQQVSDKATLDWQSFNIGPENTVRFDQPQATSVALNRIHQADPSQIMGRLTANGQVFLVNQNGFVFGPNSQVNTSSLVVSSLEIADNTLTRGITKVVDSSPASGLVAALSGDGRVYRVSAGGGAEKIAIRVEAGAKLATHAANGRILLAAPSIENQGQIEAADGQVILAAATDKVYLQEADPNSDLRGVLVEVQTGGSITNLGRVLAQRGNATLIGFALRQQGEVSASTSVALNGSVRLLAREGAALQQVNGAYKLIPQTTLRGADSGDGLGTQASVTLANGSHTAVDLDTSGGSAVDEQAQPHSRMDVEAGRILLQAGSLLQAKGGTVNLTASERPDSPLVKTSGTNESRILLEAGSKIDVSGTTDTVLPMSRNLLSLQLLKNELRDAPLQKSGPLYKSTVQVDVCSVDQYGHLPIADVSGAIARIQRSVSERNAQGGTVNLASEGDVVLNPGAQIDLSGGLIRYLGGFINTTKLVDAEGRMVDIANADPLKHYTQIFGSFSKTWKAWGITETWDLPGPLRKGVYEEGYEQGQNAGQLNIKSREVLMEAEILSRTVDGILQRHSSQRPDGGSLSIDTAWSGERQQAVAFKAAQTLTALVGDAAFPRAEDPASPASLVLGNAVFAGGVRHLTVNSMGSIAIDSGLTLNVPANGSLNLTGGEIDVQGSINAPSGQISLQTQPVSGNSPSLSGAIQLATDSKLNVSGLWINDITETGNAPNLEPLPIDGGNVSVFAQGDLLLPVGSAIAANGGGWMSLGTPLTAGKGGNIALKTASPQGPSQFLLGAALSSFALEQGGRLDIAANAIEITPDAQPQADSKLTLAPQLLENQGFSQINLTANGGDLVVAPDVNLQLRALNYRLTAPRTPSRLGFGDSPTLTTLTDDLRKPVGLSLNLKHSASVGGYEQDRAIILEQGASIRTDPGAVVSFNSDANIRLNGLIDAPAGQIEASLQAPAYTPLPDYNPNQAIALGPLARLSVAGTTLFEPNTQALKLGEVLPGGSITLQASRGYVLMDQGAFMDVSGSAERLDLFQQSGPHIGDFAQQTIASGAGAIQISAAEGIVLEGPLLGKAGGPQAGGGSLSLELNAQFRAEPRSDTGAISPNFPSSPRIIHLSEQAASHLDNDWFSTGAIPEHLNGQAYLASSQVESGGFTGLSLNSAVIVPDDVTDLSNGPTLGAIQLDGGLTLNVERKLVLDAPVLAWHGEAATAVLSSAYIALGSTLNQQAPGLTGSGPGRVELQAGWLDLVGALETQGLASTRLRSAADLRLIGVNPNQEQNLRGEFVTAGDLTLSARQIYPSTLSEYRIQVDSALNPNGLIQITTGDRDATIPLSAAGFLTVSAPRIESQGVLRAPLGEIDLSAGQSLRLEVGSLTSTSAAGALIPFGRTQAGLDWVYPLGAYTRIFSAPPSQAIHLSGSNIQFEAGATVDMSGGGDLTAFEFIPGIGGSVDQLNRNDPGFVSGAYQYQPSFAVLPGLGSVLAPYDALESPSAGLSAGDKVYLSGGNGLAAGNYTLLPAHYALLPGAFLVTAQANTRDLQAGHSMQRTDGTPIVAGYRYTAGTPERDSRWSGFAIEAGEMARTRSEYSETSASQFYTQQVAANATALPLLPKDAGSLSIAANQALGLAGTLLAQGRDGGRGGRLDISADRLAIVARRSSGDAADDGAVFLSAGELNQLKVESLLLGGRRTETAGAMQVSVDALSVSLRNGALLQGPEVILVAKDDLSLSAGSGIRASGNVTGVAPAWQTAGGGALLRVASGGQVNLVRDVTAGEVAVGRFDLEQGAVLRSDGAVLLDASGDIRWQSQIAMEHGSLSLGASRISLGDAPTGTSGLLLNSALLAPIHADELRLNSTSSLDLYGGLDFNTDALFIHAAGIRGFGASGQTARLSANSISLDNASSATETDASPTGSGQLQLAADRLLVGPGAFGLNGFAQIQLDATDAFVGSGTGQLQVGGDLALNTGKITANAGADTLIDAGNHAVTTTHLDGGEPSAVAAGLGAKLEIRAGDIVHQGLIELPAGAVSLNAAFNLSLADGSVIDVSGRQVNLAGIGLYAAGGHVALRAGTGNITVSPTASLDVSAAKHGGHAGSLSLQAANGTINLAGGLAGQANAGFDGGQFSLDALGLVGVDFATLNQYLQNGGFNKSLNLRLRSGDLTLAANQWVQAESVSLSVDSGRLIVQGTVDASGPAAGTIQLAAGDRLLIEDSARLLATASQAGKKGGSINLESVDADGDGLQGVTVRAGAQINVAGGPDGAGGSVAVRVGRAGADDAAVDLAAGVVISAAQQTVEAVKIYQDLALSNAQINRWRDETASYMSAASANAGLQYRLGGFALMPGLDIQSSGDMSLNLSDTLKDKPWTQQGFNLYYTQLDELAGAVGTIQQTASNGTVRTLTAASSSSLTADGTYFFDTDPSSPTFRRLTLRVFPDNSQGLNRYDPRKIRDNVAETNGWDFLFPSATGQTWRFGAEQTPGVLSLRAAGNLTVEKNLSDGFAVLNARQLAAFYGITQANWLNTLMLQTGESWSYRLVAGADLGGVDPLAVRADGSDFSLTLGASTAVRTGTGSIDLVSSGDIKLTDQTSTLYTAGRPTASSRYGVLSNATVVQSFNAEYPIDGGSISLQAGRDIIGAASSQLMSDWLARTGDWDATDGTATDRPTAWGIVFDGIVVQNSFNSRIQNLKMGFQENIGALGGGDVTVKAGRTIQDLSVMLPTTAKSVGNDSNAWDLQGGGKLNVKADGDIKGGVFFVDKGEADIQAGGSILGGSQYTAGPVFALGDAQFNVTALDNINIGAALNPYWITPAKTPDKPAYFTTYTDATRISLTALAGDIHFNNDLNILRQQYKMFDSQSPKGRSVLNSFDTPLLGVYPGSLQAYALSGAMDLGASFSLFPAHGGVLELMAAGDLSTQEAGVSINQSDLEPALLLNPALPAQSLNQPSNGLIINWLYGSDPIPAKLHAATPVHTGDLEPVRIVSERGSINAGQGLLLTTAKPVEVYAGLDIIGLGLLAQNIEAGAVSSVMAGRDLKYPLQRDPVTGEVLGSSQSIELAGPGALRVLAGRSIDLGSSDGIRTVGNLLNPALAKDGADVLLLAGLVEPKTYLSLPKSKFDGLFGQLRLSAKEAAATQDEAVKAAAYRRGYQAIAQLFPKTDYQGDIKLFFSTIQTLDGGNLQLLAPGGLVNVGLPTAFSGNKTADQLGIVVQGEGGIDILVNGDLQVNRSRVATLDGGDITVWSSYGNIDAGRGAKSALSAPLPITSFDSQGNLVVTFPPTVSASGIRAQSGTGNAKKGDVYLAAPEGIVDLNEAGGEGNNVVIAASLVLNSFNLSFLGQASGIPQTPTFTPPPVNIGNGLAAVTDAALSMPQTAELSQSLAQQAIKPVNISSALSAQVVGFGDCSVSDVKSGKPGCGN